MVQSFFFQGLTKKERQFRANEIREQHRQSLVNLSMMPSTNGVWKDEGFVSHVIDA
jgi:Zn-finger nucleic acid-binding protein